jgi:Fur family peroxide stress response transcriptional regulator
MEKRKITSLLRRMGLKATPQRVELIRLIMNLIKEHPSFNSIVKNVKSRYPTISVSTVYNTIMLMVRKGLIKKFDYEGEMRLDSSEPHINVVYRDRGVIEDLPNGKILEELEEAISKKAGRCRVENVIVIVRKIGKSKNE